MQVVWIFLSYNLFYALAYTLFSMSNGLMVPLSTRNMEQRGKLSVFVQISTTAVTGVFVALIFPSLILPAIGIDRSRWILVMSLFAILALPLTLLQYYYTKERITEEDTQDRPAATCSCCSPSRWSTPSPWVCRTSPWSTTATSSSAVTTTAPPRRCWR
ncbi:sugar (Glycoside-Pentoside-Hexuronide) transporter [Mycobacteroides abscessus subsp. abscessus]|nr:sugar (Glycoside-Pentoside-Hexuronide) transporter [Mycobacteroides abscessus subsp. abscessus]